MVADRLGRRARPAGLPLRAARRRAHARRAAPRRAGRARPSGCAPASWPGLRPADAAPDGRRGPRRRAPAARRVQPRARAARAARGRPADRRAGPRGRRRRACPACARSACELARRDGVAQVSTNVEDHRAVPLAALLEAVARHAPVARGRARRPRPAGRVRRLARRRPGAGTARRSRTPSRLDATMAQTKKKRSTKHRGNAAGVVEARGRTGRKLTDEEKAQERRGAGGSAPAGRPLRPPADLARRRAARRSSPS